MAAPYAAAPHTTPTPIPTELARTAPEVFDAPASTSPSMLSPSPESSVLTELLFPDDDDDDDEPVVGP